jgi:23S rRNA (cytosine1962-C5)-methyltransferase
VTLPPLPAPSDRRLALRTTPAAQAALRAGHPWLFDRAITHQSAEGQPGDLAVVFDDRRRFVAIGLYDPTSPLRVRVLQHGEPATIDRAWLAGRLAAAAARRVALAATGTTGYRLVHGENDGLPGLVIDRYEDVLVLKLDTLAWVPRLADVLAVLETLVPAQSVVLRLTRSVAARPEFLHGLADDAVLAGPRPDQPVLFSENGLRFEADVFHGQKTGFFLDQRDNRARVEALAAGKRMLNVFAYTGGFSLYAARGGAPEVWSVDLSMPALAAAERTFALNAHVPAVAAARHRTLAGDAFAVLDDLRRQGERFALVVVDPPAFAKAASEAPAALHAYRRLTQLALGVVVADAVLVLASCSSRVSAPAFFEAVHSAAAQAGRPLREIERTGHPLDHPISFAEGAYLKCWFAQAP